MHLKAVPHLINQNWSWPMLYQDWEEQFQKIIQLVTDIVKTKQSKT